SPGDVEPAGCIGAEQRPLQPLLVVTVGRPGIDRTDFVVADGLDRLSTELGGEVDQVVVGEPLELESRGLRRDRLRRGVVLSGDVSGWRGPFLDREDRL